MGECVQFDRVQLADVGRGASGFVFGPADHSLSARVRRGRVKRFVAQFVIERVERFERVKCVERVEHFKWFESIERVGTIVRFVGVGVIAIGIQPIGIQPIGVVCFRVERFRNFFRVEREPIEPFVGVERFRVIRFVGIGIVERVEWFERVRIVERFERVGVESVRVERVAIERVERFGFQPIGVEPVAIERVGIFRVE